MRRRDIGEPHARPQATDLDAIDPPRPFRPPVEPLSGILTLHLILATGQFGPAIKDETRVRLRSGLEAAGIPRGYSVWADPGDRMGWELPRGIAWTDYPVVGTPRVKEIRGREYPIVDIRHASGSYGTPIPADRVLSDLGNVIVHLPDDIRSPDPARRARATDWAASALAWVTAVHASVPVTLVSGDATPVGDRDDLRALASGAAAARRFAYAYAANFTAIGLKALERCLPAPDPGAAALLKRLHGVSPDPSSVDMALSRVRTRMDISGLLNPLALQALYALARRDGVPVPFLGPDDPAAAWRALLTPEGYAYPSWTGTGRYPSRPIHKDEVVSVGSALIRYRLVTADGDRLLVSATGRAFLDALHPDCEDVDMPVRWAGRDAAPGDAEAMDRWITRTFRRMKSRVNAGDLRDDGGPAVDPAP
jgi:hypothetical protein